MVGLITTDGCLSSDGRHINITSKDIEFVIKLKDSLGLLNKIGVKNKCKVNEAYYLDFSNRSFYEFLLSIGLTPRKSLTQDRVDVPSEMFFDFLRGVIDGDGSIRRWTHSTNKKEQWSLSIFSPSLPFVKWLQGNIEDLYRVKGPIHRDIRKRPRVDLFVLKYGKMAAKIILSKCYYKNSLSLERKAKLAKDCLNSYTGWDKSRTVLN